MEHGRDPKTDAAKPKRKQKRKVGRPKGREPLTDKHYEAIDLLSELPPPSQTEAAKLLGVSRMTLWKWRQRPDFRRLLHKEIRRKVRAKFKSEYEAGGYVSLALAGDVKAVQTILQAHELIE